MPTLASGQVAFTDLECLPYGDARVSNFFKFFLLLILFFIVCGCVHVTVGVRGARGIRSPRSPELELQAGVSLGTGYRYWVLGTGNGAQVLCNSNSRLSSPESQTSSLT